MNPDIKKDAWTLEEELDLMNAHLIYGNKWAEIAKVLPGRYHSFLVYNTCDSLISKAYSSKVDKRVVGKLF